MCSKGSQKDDTAGLVEFKLILFTGLNLCVRRKLCGDSKITHQILLGIILARAGWPSTVLSTCQTLKPVVPKNENFKKNENFNPQPYLPCWETVGEGNQNEVKLEEICIP